MTPHPAPSSRMRSRGRSDTKRASRIESIEKRYPSRGWMTRILPPRIVSQVSLLSVVVMNAPEKGERYARIFRKAGTLLGKGNIARAVEAFKEGVELARAEGHTRMAERFHQELKRAQAEPAGGAN